MEADEEKAEAAGSVGPVYTIGRGPPGKIQKDVESQWKIMWEHQGTWIQHDLNIST